jgi:hypothetical protein
VRRPVACTARRNRRRWSPLPRTLPARPPSSSTRIRSRRSLVEVLAAPVPGPTVDEVGAAEVPERDWRVAVEVQRGFGPGSAPCLCQRSRIADVWVRRFRILIGTEGAWRIWTSNGRYVLTSASRSIIPSSTSAMIPAHVRVFDTEASWNTVSLVTRIRSSRSAQPTPPGHTISSSRTTATAIPGVFASASFRRRYRSSSSVRAGAPLTNEKGAIAPTSVVLAIPVTNSRRVSSHVGPDRIRSPDRAPNAARAVGAAPVEGGDALALVGGSSSTSV